MSRGSPPYFDLSDRLRQYATAFGGEHGPEFERVLNEAADELERRRGEQ